MKLSLIFTAAALCGVGLGAHAQILLNPSFESPSLGPNSNELASAGDDWTDSVTPAAVDLTSNDYDGYGNTTFGTQYLRIYGPEGSDAPALVSQKVSGFVAGQTYTLTVDFASLTSPTGSLTLSLTGPIFYSATLLETYTAPGTATEYGTGNIPFQTATLTFIPFASGTGTVGIQSTVPGDLIAVDNVVLAAVPEPASSWEMLLGLCGLAGLSFFRRRARMAAF